MGLGAAPGRCGLKFLSRLSFELVLQVLPNGEEWSRPKHHDEDDERSGLLE